jgi:hypothetical protein
MKKIYVILLALAILLSVTGMATATSLVPDAENMVIAPGTSGTFTLTLNTSYTESGKISFTTNYPLTAQIDGVPVTADTIGQTSPFWSVMGVPSTHTLTVYMNASANPGVYETDVMYWGQNGPSFKLRAWTQPTAATPEASTGVLMSLGLVGMVGLVAMKRRRI